MPRPASTTKASESLAVELNQSNSTVLANRLTMQSDPSIPVRTLIKIEIGNMSRNDVRNAMATIAEQYTGNHTTFILPTRDGKLTTDVVFEQEIVDYINTFCEVKDGKIALKGGNVVKVDSQTHEV